jgi:hypothetical protein
MMTLILTPMVHIASIFMGITKKLVTMLINILLAPLYETMALMFSKINIRFTNVVEYTVPESGNNKNLMVIPNHKQQLTTPINYNSFDGKNQDV